MSETVTAEDTLAKRRSALKGWVLAEAALFVEHLGDYDEVNEVAKILELPPGAMQSVLDECHYELWRRQAKHPRPGSSAQVQAGTP